MLNAISLFRDNIKEIRRLEGLFNYISTTIVTPLPLEDILRSQHVYAVSAFDKLMHDLIRKGMVEVYLGKRAATKKYSAEGISLEIHKSLMEAQKNPLPPAEIIFEQALFNKFKQASFQEPLKVAEGLSYVWDEAQKWQKISGSMGMDEATVKTTLKLIVDRRNSIVHEADINPSTNFKFQIIQADCITTTNFIEKCGLEIANLVK